MTHPPLSEPGAAERAASAGAHHLDGALRPAWVGVDLDALVANFAALRRRLGRVRILAVIKADAYGHGACRVGRALEEAGVDKLGVALVEEGAELRRFGVEARTLVLGPAQPDQLALFRRYRLTPTISSLAQLEMWAGWARALGGPPQRVHLKVDTGMTRLGLAPDELPAALEAVRRHPGLELAGLASHLAEADLPESNRTAAQALLFASLLELLTAAERARIEIHLANSAGALHHAATRHGMVRLGMALFGLDPAARAPAAAGDRELLPVMSVVARIVQLREVPAGTRVSYGGRRTLARPSRIAVVPVGYADGYPWRLSDRAEALVRGRRTEIAGAVTMDMTLVDVTDAGGAVGEEVVLLGRQGEEEITAPELAARAGTIPYEILCGFGLRLPRRYRRDGVWGEVLTRFSGEGR